MPLDDDRDPAARLLAALPPPRKRQRPSRAYTPLRERGVHPALVDKTAVCEHRACGKTYTPRPGETEAEWKARRACSPACGKIIGKQAWRGGLGRLGKGNY